MMDDNNDSKKFARWPNLTPPPDGNKSDEPDDYE
jgi:hypothetical protein